MHHAADACWDKVNNEQVKCEKDFEGANNSKVNYTKHNLLEKTPK